MIRTLRGTPPWIAASAYIDPGAHPIGDVSVGERASRSWRRCRSVAAAAFPKLTRAEFGGMDLRAKANLALA